MTAEQPNLRAGLAESIAGCEVESAWHWIAALQRFWDVTGQHLEARDWIGRVRGLGDPPATPGVAAGLAAASAILHNSDARDAYDLAAEAARLATGLDDVTKSTAALAVGTAAMWIEPELMLPKLHEALALLGDDHPWDRALTVLMAQRAMYAGIADDEVHEWLTESRALAEAAGSEEDQVHATLAFGQLAWLRGDHDEAALLVAGTLPTLRRLGDQRCAARALYVLGERAYEQGDLAQAERLMASCVEAVVLAGQSFVLVRALEALAAVLFAQGRRGTAAVCDRGTAPRRTKPARTVARPRLTLNFGRGTGSDPCTLRCVSAAVSSLRRRSAATAAAISDGINISISSLERPAARLRAIRTPVIRAPYGTSRPCPAREERLSGLAQGSIAA
ncbi:hypothetical protein EV646_104154 [Kribbella antiqua]|uniref:MalT-like TPR region domain-containing protein n=1 Tax=Kribbella antiqua TaxID=2512217 RepID=A0A4R2ITC1_9ACTN|nr:hypothetical protein [Kribbella antiqua]TCO48337.1 hypothetical protein EV646_104154 [Kribbella antiqua]